MAYPWRDPLELQTLSMVRELQPNLAALRFLAISSETPLRISLEI